MGGLRYNEGLRFYTFVALLLLSAFLPSLGAFAKKAKKSTSVKRKPSRKIAKKVVASSPPRQGSPTSERYREIQSALNRKGYYGGEVHGEWNAESVEALKKFQADQNLKADGKLGSLSIIALGLGPQRDLVE